MDGGGTDEIVLAGSYDQEGDVVAFVVAARTWSTGSAASS
jgi:hypothetical protein